MVQHKRMILSGTGGILLVTISAFLIMAGCSKPSPSSIMPGTKIWDITDPASWGGDPALAATPDNPADDDAPAINAAMAAVSILFMCLVRRRGIRGG